MKKILSFLILVAFFQQSQAQLANFVMTPDTLVVNGTTSADALKVDVEVKNTANITRTFVWERTIVSITQPWYTQVCDPIACWAPGKSSGEFELAGNSSGGMVLDVFTEQTAGTAYVKMKYYQKGSLKETVTGRYRFNAQSVNTAEIEAAQLKLYPNPTTEYFVLDGNAPLTEVQVLSMDGKVMKTFPYIQNDIYEVEDMPNGAYMISLNGEKGKRLATKKIFILK